MNDRGRSEAAPENNAARLVRYKATPRNRHQAIDYGPRELTAWLRGRINIAAYIWRRAGHPANTVATLTTHPDECARCGGSADQLLTVTLLHDDTIGLLVVGMLCDECYAREGGERP